MFTCAACLVTAMFTSDLKRDEEVVFYGGYAARSDDGTTWTALVRGSVFEPEQDSIKRKLVIAGIRRSLEIDKESDEGGLFNQRMHYFLVDFERRKRVTIRLGEREHAVGPSAAGGQFEQSLEIPAAEAARLAKTEAGAEWLAFTVVLPKGDERRFGGRIQLVPPAGLSVISDIDDTIKVTDVRDRKEMLRNTFLREFRPVEGMPELYQRLARQGAAFHYVSGGPWQLFPPLEEFRAKHGFPPGSFHMKQFSLADPRGLAKLKEHGEAKETNVEALLKAFPQRRFILIGDSGEQDPEIYGKLARKHAAQIVAVWIRDASNERAEDERFQKAFADVPRSKWRLFDDPTTLKTPD